MASPPSGTSPGLSSRASFLRETATQLLGLILSKVPSPGARPASWAHKTEALGALRALLGASSLLHCVLPRPRLPCSQASEAPLTGGFWGCRVKCSRLLPLPRKLQSPCSVRSRDPQCLHFTGTPPTLQAGHTLTRARADLHHQESLTPLPRPSVRGCGMSSALGGLPKKASENRGYWVLMIT